MVGLLATPFPLRALGVGIPFVAVLVAGVAGCGSTASTAPGDAAAAQGPPHELVVKGPIPPERKLPPPLIPRRYQCDNGLREVWLPLRWSRVPKGTSELAVVVAWSLVDQWEGGYEASTKDVWIMGGLPPRRRKLPIGPLPDGAFVNVQHNYDEPCPTGDEYRVTFRVYALPEAEFLTASESVSFETVGRIDEVALASGSLTGSYRFTG